MNIKTKGLFKVLVIALSMLFAVALAFGISGAWYNTTREAKGTLSMAKGIVIDYSGFNQGADVWEDNASFNLFASQNGMLPGQSVELYNTKIKANASSIDFYARAKLEYKFFTDVEGLTEVTSQIADYSVFINTPTFAQGWVDGRNGDGWFYYATGATFNTIPSADYVDIFAPGQSLTLNIDAPGFNHQGGGYQYSSTILIKRITVTLTLNALQANTAAAEFNGWEINPLVENSNSQVVEIYSNQITLGNVGGAYKLGTGEAGTLSYDTTTLGTTLKIVVAGDSQINANAFENSGLEEIYIGDQDYINGVSSYAARIYSSPATITIGANAFKGCTNLTINLSSSCNYVIYTGAFADVAHIYYDTTDITYTVQNASDGDSYSTISFVAPQIAIGGESVEVSLDSSKGDYTYTDSQAVWYFKLGTVSRVNTYNGMLNINCPSDALFKFGYNAAEITYCDLKSSSENQTITFPNIISVSELSGSFPVLALGDYDANGLFDENERGLVTSVILPNQLRIIRRSFNWCENLMTCEFPETLTTIGQYSFAGTALTTISLPSSLIYCDYTAFNELSQQITSITSYSNNYIVDNRSLISVYGELILFAGSGFSGSYTIPNSVTHICNYLFAYCDGITSITIPNSVKYIGISVFFCCTGLETVTFEGGGTRDTFNIREGAFNDCSSLATVNFTGDWTGINITIGDNTFVGCPIEGNVQLPSQS